MKPEATDEETDNKLKFYFNMTMMQLIMQAGMQRDHHE